jgi:flagellar hook-associated protein 1 FlgK
MSLSVSLHTALSGLAAATRAADVVSSNIANALTPGYGARSLVLSARGGDGFGGVQVAGVQRDVDPALLGDRRRAGAALGDAQAQADFLTRLGEILGAPDDPGALSARITAFEAALTYAAGDPSAPQRLEGAVDAAERLASGLRAASADVQAQRAGADAAIGDMVDRLNAGLARVQDLNAAVAAATARGEDIAGLLDRRQREIDALSEIVPLREVARRGGAVALYTAGGAAMLDGTPATIGFDRSPVITPGMTMAGGALSGLTFNGRAAAPSAIAGGRMEGMFAVRDDLAVSAQTGLDALARDLVERLEGIPDPTRAPGTPALFTDAGAAFTPADESGLAARITVNDSVRPDAGGAAWRLRDGVGAVGPGTAGGSGLLEAMRTTLAEARAPASGGFGPAPRGLAALAADLAGQAAGRLQDAETRQSHAAARHAQLTAAEARRGVDTDAEMQSLLVIEQLYGANARMIRAIDEMMDTLVRL